MSDDRQQMRDWRLALLDWFTENPPPDSPEDTRGIALHCCFEVAYLTPPHTTSGDGDGNWLHSGSAARDGGSLPFYIREGMLASALRDTRRSSMETAE